MKGIKSPVFIICGKSPIEAYGGGYSSYAYNLARILKGLNFEVYILSLGSQNKIINIQFAKLVQVKSIFSNFNITALPFLPLYSFLFAQRIKKVAEEKNYNKFIIWGIGPWGLTGVILKKLTGNKVTLIDNYFTTIRHEAQGTVKAVRVKDYGIILKLKYLAAYYTIVQFLAFWESIVLRSADLIITNYKSTERIIQKEFGIPKNRFERSHFFAEPHERKVKGAVYELNEKLPKRFLLFISRHDPRKGVNFLLHALSILVKQKRAIPLIIAGQGVMLEANKRLAKKLNLENWVKFVGFVNNPKDLMRKATVFVFPTLEEGAGALVVNEAMTMGCPIVATDCDGIKEDIKNEESGLLVPAQSELFAKAIIRLLNNPKFAKTLGNNAKKRIRQDFTFEKMQKDTEVLIDRFL